MTRTQKKAFKKKLRSSIKQQQKQLKSLVSAGSRLHIGRERFFRQATSELKKEIRFFQRLNKRVK